MPSLRRSVSDSYSNPRSSPYPSTLSLSASGALNANNGSGSMRLRRAASGSETSTRRVLADIEWWRVTPGQHSDTDDNASEEDSNINQEDDSPTFPLLGLGLQEDLAAPTVSTSTATASMLSDESFSTLDAAFVLEDTAVFSTSDVSSQGVGALLLQSPFASLSIIDGMPQTPPRSRSVSAASSTESSPEASPRTPAMHAMYIPSGKADELERQNVFGLSLGFDTNMDFGCSEFSDIAFGDCEVSLSPSLSGGSRPSPFDAVHLLRSASFDSSFDASVHTSDDRFGDVLFV